MQPRKTAQRAFRGLVGLPLEPEAKPIQNPTLKGTVVSEEELRRNFGVDEAKTKAHIPDSWRKFFELEPEDLIGFFDAEVGGTHFIQIDFIVPPAMIQHRLRRLQMIINRGKEIIEGLDARVMKIRRGKDDPLLKDKAAREKYKRKEQARLARCYAKRQRYYAATKQAKYVEKVWRLMPICLRDVVDDWMEFETVIESKWVEHESAWACNKLCSDITGWVNTVENGVFDLPGYKAVMKLGPDALEELGETDEEKKKAWKNLLRWENAVIAAAVSYGVFKPPVDRAKFLGLDRAVAELNATVRAEDEDQEGHTVAELGVHMGRMRIQTEGGRRTLSSFDKPTKMTIKG